MLQVWFSSIPFVLSEYSVKKTTPLEVHGKDKQCLTLPSFVGVSRNDEGKETSTADCQVQTNLSATVKCVEVVQNI
jgi:hypothetical protein